MTSARIQEIIVEILSDGNTHSVQEIKNKLSQFGDDYTEGQFAGSINTLLRNKTICKLDRGVYTMNVNKDNKRKCFVVSPIGEEGSETRMNADKLYKYIIKPICDACGFEAERVDKINDANSISQTIIESLETADLVIADITEHNPNVFYEMGYRARTKKPMIHLRKKGEKLPFDVNTIRTLEYDLTDLDSVDKVKDRLTKTIDSFTFSDDNVQLEKEEVTDNLSSSIMPVLYQILDAMQELRKDVKSFSSETIGTVVKSMQSTQPQVSSDTALQMQLLNGFMQNPEGFARLIEISDQFNNK